MAPTTPNTNTSSARVARRNVANPTPRTPIRKVTADRQSRSPLKTPIPAEKHKNLTNKGWYDMPEMGTEVVKLIVGSEKQVFTVHKKLLCDKIPYFDKMFNGGWKETVDQVAEFPEDDPQDFDNLYLWVYYDKIKEFTVTNGVWAYPICSLYRLASKLCIAPLQNIIMATLILALRVAGRRLTPSFCQKIWTSFAPNKCGLRDYAAHCVAQYIVDGNCRRDDKAGDEKDILRILDLFAELPELAFEAMLIVKESNGMVKCPSQLKAEDFWEKERVERERPVGEKEKEVIVIQDSEEELVVVVEEDVAEESDFGGVEEDDFSASEL